MAFISFLLQLDIPIQNGNPSLALQFIYTNKSREELLCRHPVCKNHAPQGTPDHYCSPWFLSVIDSGSFLEEWGFLLYYPYYGMCYTWIVKNLNAIK